jgi:nitroimidazol reductase NimA-like FMN-containing flavoprotein (pyridoxamine 5'-phosphate oxidase superfamily)
MESEDASLDTQQCLRLLAGMAVGRIVYTKGAMPAVLPVPFRLDADGSVVLAQSAASELVRAVDGAVIAFETGEVSGVDGSGWSVTILGRASVAPERSARPGAAAGTDRVLIRIHPEVVTGRRLESPPAATPP